jgi:DNA-directed RNA polymerase specialized sigma24 family protein
LYLLELQAFVGPSDADSPLEQLTYQEDLSALLAAGLTRKELVALALHLYDGMSAAAIGRHQGCDKKVAQRRLKNAIKKLEAAKIPVSGVNRPPVKVIAVSKLGRLYESGNPDLEELQHDV